LLIAIIIGINILYFLITGRGIGRSMRIPKMMLHPDIRSKHPYLESKEDQGIDDSDKDLEDLEDFENLEKSEDSESEFEDHDNDVVEMVDEAEPDLEAQDTEITDLDDDMIIETNGVPVTEVDLTNEDQPFLESEELIEELSEDSTNSTVKPEQSSKGKDTNDSAVPLTESEIDTSSENENEIDNKETVTSDDDSQG
jgi:hypothetical protein